jgi:hypothetical protein
MYVKSRFSVCSLACLLAAGCGDAGYVKAKGRIIKGGQPYITEEGVGVRMVFEPMEMPEGTKYDSYAAAYDPDDGSFFVMGKQQKGLPPGNYRVSIQLMEKKEDLLGGKLLGARSPLTVVVDPRGNNDLVIDLDKANFDKLLADAAAKPAKRGSGKKQRGASTATSS